MPVQCTDQVDEALDPDGGPAPVDFQYDIARHICLQNDLMDMAVRRVGTRTDALRRKRNVAQC